MLGFGPFCLNLGHIGWIWAIWQNLSQNRPQRRQSPEDEAGGVEHKDVWKYGQIPPVFYRTLSPLGTLPKKDKKIHKSKTIGLKVLWFVPCVKKFPLSYFMIFNPSLRRALLPLNFPKPSQANSHKSVRWSAVPVAPMSVCGCEVVRGAAAPKGPMTYA